LALAFLMPREGKGKGQRTARLVESDGRRPAGLFGEQTPPPIRPFIAQLPDPDVRSGKRLVPVLGADDAAELGKLFGSERGAEVVGRSEEGRVGREDVGCLEKEKERLLDRGGA
jgi:hypothetical protein